MAVNIDLVRRVDAAKSHPLFPYFEKWADGNGIDMEFPDDWVDWWECYISGAMGAADLAYDLQKCKKKKGNK